MSGSARRSSHFCGFRDQAFIEAAVEPFRRWQSAIGRVLFVFLQQQDERFAVRQQLATMFEGLPWEAVVLDEPTPGPAVTMTEAVRRSGATGAAIVCDCDHAVNVDPLFEEMAHGGKTDCILPVWDLAGEDVKSWSVAAIDERGRVTAIAEKRVPAGAQRTAGVIGCYCFREVAEVAAGCRRRGDLVVSDAVARLIDDGRTVTAVPIREAQFFGDPARLAKAVEAGGKTN